MLRLPVTLLTFALTLSSTQAGVCPAKSSGSSGYSGSGGGKGGYPTTTSWSSAASTTYTASISTDTSSGASSVVYTTTISTSVVSSIPSGNYSGTASTSTVSATSTSNASVPTATTFTYGTDKVRGVNLGGWLVLESWITPSLFEATGNEAIVDEWTFGELQDNETALAALQQHWDTWYTEQDFKDIAAAGLNHVRCPIGYWAFDVSEGEPYLQGQLPYLQKAIAWAEAAGLKLVIDLHGAPGSQNGYDNSGHRIPYPTWQTSEDNIVRTEKVLEQIAGLFAGNSSVATVIAPLNEPAGYNGTQMLDAVHDYYTTGYNIVRHPNGQGPDSSIIVLLHDAFENGTYWGDFMAEGTHDIAMDTHQYQTFTNALLNQTLEEHIQTACNLSSAIEEYELPVIVGEWSTAATDCARWVNGRGIGSRWDGTYPDSPFNNSCAGFSGDASTFSDDYKTFLRQYWEAQADAFETSWGWIAWAWKFESGTAEEWSYSKGLEYGWIPQNPTERMYPDVCSSASSPSSSTSSTEYKF